MNLVGTTRTTLQLLVSYYYREFELHKGCGNEKKKRKKERKKERERVDYILLGLKIERLASRESV